MTLAAIPFSYVHVTPSCVRVYWSFWPLGSLCVHRCGYPQDVDGTGKICSSDLGDLARGLGVKLEFCASLLCWRFLVGRDVLHL